MRGAVVHEVDEELGEGDGELLLDAEETVEEAATAFVHRGLVTVFCELLLDLF